uniref:Protein white-like n=1 Tax=Saccoglossus kowalevskii TaxID=10224 RepID=A0ABM0N194_SACKO|nr:PREDICTED: protein white-like [Saccoglossus kowalevskii]
MVPALGVLSFGILHRVPALGASSFGIFHRVPALGVLSFGILHRVPALGVLSFGILHMVPALGVLSFGIFHRVPALGVLSFGILHRVPALGVLSFGILHRVPALGASSFGILHMVPALGVLSFGILHRVPALVNGYAKVGRVLAVLGASGSGKSTLLDTLTFRSDGNLSVQGNIMANGEPVDSSITSVMAYVQQDEFFITKLTVREHLQFQAALRMNSEYHFHSKLEKVENLLVELDLIDCADTLIGQPHCNGITLCERKKLSIASELLTNQPVIFYDEPTHGLDADAAMDIIQTLKGFASIGHTVICTFRKTSSQLYGLFDNIMLLADGRCVYFGSPSQAIHFFSTMGYTCPPYYCPADYFLHILATLPDSIEELCKSFDNSSFGSKAYETRQDETFKARVRRSSSVRDRLQKIKYYNTDWCTQFANLLWRNFVAMKRSIFLFHVHFLHLVVIREELPLIVYENKIGLYRFDSYLIARYMAQLPSSILYPIVSSTIVYWMTGLNPGWRNYFVFVGIIILVTNAGASFGLFLSVLTSSQNVIIIISMIFILPVLTMGGYFINIASSPVYLEWLEYFSWYKYAFEALSINQWKDLDAKGCNYSIKVQCMESGENVLKQLSIDQVVLGVIVHIFRKWEFNLNLKVTLLYKTQLLSQIYKLPGYLYIKIDASIVLKTEGKRSKAGRGRGKKGKSLTAACASVSDSMSEKSFPTLGSHHKAPLRSTSENLRELSRSDSLLEVAGSTIETRPSKQFAVEVTERAVDSTGTTMVDLNSPNTEFASPPDITEANEHRSTAFAGRSEFPVTTVMDIDKWHVPSGAPTSTLSLAVKSACPSETEPVQPTCTSPLPTQPECITQSQGQAQLPPCTGTSQGDKRLSQGEEMA